MRTKKETREDITERCNAMSKGLQCEGHKNHKGKHYITTGKEYFSDIESEGNFED